ncbi:MAG: hypothetical protein IT182_06370, partial [Acidobacteria bacterium]|nr:hypothetical protein [Acidobacteriota bacterium]
MSFTIPPPAGAEPGPAVTTEPVHFLVASDFDQTLSFNDSGVVLSELIGASGFEEKVAGLATSNLVHQGGELAYLLRHDPEFRAVRREHLVEAGRRVRLKLDIPQLLDVLRKGVDETYRDSVIALFTQLLDNVRKAICAESQREANAMWKREVAD